MMKLLCLIVTGTLNLLIEELLFLFYISVHLYKSAWTKTLLFLIFNEPYFLNINNSEQNRTGEGGKEEENK